MKKTKLKKISVIILILTISLIALYKNNVKGVTNSLDANTVNTSENVTNTATNTSTEASNQTNGTQSTGSSTSEATSSQYSTTSSRSSNANLSILGIRPNDFTGFKSGTTTYNVTVPEDVESVEVYATASDSRATISGTGTKSLNIGENALSVVVTAEDGTTKTYTINVTRQGEQEETAGEEDTGGKNGLSNIRITDLELSPSFATDVYEYTVKYIGEDTALDIQAVATDPDYIVEILGNEGLQEGENIITILVSDEDGNNVATYQLTVNKSLVDEEAQAREEEERQQEEQRRMFMIIGGIVAVILIIVIVIIIKRRRNRAYAEEFSGIPFAGINDEDDYSDYNNEENNENINSESTITSPKSEEDNYNLQEDEQNNNDNLQEHDDNDNEKEEKERARQEFLNSYNSENDDYSEEEKPRRGRRKGKRFK